MQVNQLINLIITYIDDLKKSKEKNARFRINHYNAVIKLLNNLSGSITKAKIDALPLTKHMKDKLLDFTSGKITKQQKLIADLTGVKGIGLDRAHTLIDEGLTDIKQLKIKKWFDKLPEETKMHILYNPIHIKRETITKFKNSLDKFNLLIHFTGSYRREKPISRDIDIMCIGSLTDFIHTLETLYEIHIYARGINKISLIIKMDHYYKLDVFRVDESNAGSMLLYSTGSKEFNIKMRGIAKRQGYLLNQNGLFKNGKKITLKTEKDYFTFLSMKYIEPRDR